MQITLPDEDRSLLRIVLKAYELLLLAGFSVLPLFVIAYVYYFQDPLQTFENHLFHELAIGISILIGGFVSYITWRCFQYSGEPFLRWLTVGFLGFTLVYAPHGVFTPFAHDNIWLFLLYGPASRLVMAGCFLYGLLQYGKTIAPVSQRSRKLFWWSWLTVFVLIDLAVAALAYAPIAGEPVLRLSMEIGAIGVSLLNIAIMILRRIRSPLMIVYAIALASFAQSSLAFVLSLPWNHMWWLAHAIFAGGFFSLSYGIIRAYHTTRSFSTVYSQVELMEQLRQANQNLETLASTDSLTGAFNRREFLSRTDVERARALRAQYPLSVLALDLDHFKAVNDIHGHQSGDKVLQEFVRKLQSILRPGDIIGRMGGEEFLVLLPEANRSIAEILAERIRREIESLEITSDGNTMRITVSIGVAQFDVDGDSRQSCFKAADDRLYRAKESGRNCVVAR